MISFSNNFLETETGFNCNVEPKTDEGRLKKRLFCNYDKYSRPTVGDAATIVKIRLIVKGFNFNDQENKLTLSSWLAMVKFKIYIFSCEKILTVPT